MPPLHISGTLIDFPHEEPYGPQKVLMGKVVAALDRRAHALLEAPTGSGKTLALLCAALAWQMRLTEEGCVPHVGVWAGGTRGQRARERDGPSEFSPTRRRTHAFGETSGRNATTPTCTTTSNVAKRALCGGTTHTLSLFF